MKLFLLIVVIIGGKICWAQQAGQLDCPEKKPGTKELSTGMDLPGLDGSGAIGIFDNGQVNAAGRLIKINIGEPGKWVIPLSVWSGVSASVIHPAVGTEALRENAGAFLVNPAAGLINIRVEDLLIRKKDRNRLSKYGWRYALGGRLYSMNKTVLPVPMTTTDAAGIWNGYLVAGCYMQTGAWGYKDQRTGVCWLSVQYIGNWSSESKWREIVPERIAGGWQGGYTISWGIDIARVLQLKITWFKNIARADLVRQPGIIQFCFASELGK